MSNLHIRYLDKDEFGLWDKFISIVPCAAIFDGTEYLTAICDAFGCGLSILAVFNGDEITGGVTLSVSKKYTKSIATRIPLCPTNSCIISPLPTSYPAKEVRHVLEITDAIASFLKSNFDFVSITNNHYLMDIRSFSWQDYRLSVQYTYHVDLSLVNMSSITPNRRNKISNAKKTGIIVEEMEMPDAAYELLDKTYHRKGKSPPLTYEQFDKIYKRLGRERIRLLFARLPDNEKPAAVNITVTDTERKIGYSLLRGFNPDYKDSNAASFVQLKEIEYLQERGFKILDLVGAENQSIALFKSEFGGKLIPYYQVWYASTGYRILNLVHEIFNRGMV